MSSDKCKVIFFGTPEFAVPALEALIKADFCDVVAVVTQPDKAVGRHRSKLIASPVKMAAQGLKIPVLEGFDGFKASPYRHPDRAQQGEWRDLIVYPRDASPALREGRGRDDAVADLGILVAYGEILPKSLLDHFPLGIVNIHPSLLPKYRGPSPIQAAILNRDQETGVSIIKLDEGMDSGPIIAQEVVSLRAPSGALATDGAKQSYNLAEQDTSDNQIHRNDKIASSFHLASLGVAPRNDNLTAGELHDKLAQIGAELLIKILPDYIAGKIKPIPQEGQTDLSPSAESKAGESKASYTKKLTKEDGKIDWIKSAEEIDALVRAMNPWPGAWTIWNRKRLIIWKASLVSLRAEPEAIAKGGAKQSDSSDEDNLSNDSLQRIDKIASVVSTLPRNDNAGLFLQEVQLEGKKRMPFKEFLKGHPNFILPSSSQ